MICLPPLILWKGLDTAWVLFRFVARFLSLFFSFLCGFVSSLNPSGEILSLALARGLRLQWLVPVEARPSRLTYVLLQGTFFAFMASLVTYIHQSGILSLSHFLATFIHLRNLVTQATSVIYIRLSEILSLSFYSLVPVRRVVSNLHPSRRNLVT